MRSREMGPNTHRPKRGVAPFDELMTRRKRRPAWRRCGSSLTPTRNVSPAQNLLLCRRARRTGRIGCAGADAPGVVDPIDAVIAGLGRLCLNVVIPAVRPPMRNASERRAF